MKKLNTEEFIRKAEEIHGKVYDYSKTVYTKATIKVDIICREHGLFSIAPNHHTSSKQGCPKCGIFKNSKSRLLSTKDFIDKSIKIHGDRYDYSMVNYTGTKNNVDVICKDHGVFSITCNGHTSGKKGCPKCAEYLRGWYDDVKWEETGNISPNFDSFKLYIIKCYNNEIGEEFYKIGKTFLRISKRFSNSGRLPYKFDIVKVIEDSARNISNIERELHKENKSFKYIPKIKFGGMHECFSKIIDIGN